MVILHVCLEGHAQVFVRAVFGNQRHLLALDRALRGCIAHHFHDGRFGAVGFDAKLEAIPVGKVSGDGASFVKLGWRCDTQGNVVDEGQVRRRCRDGRVLLERVRDFGTVTYATRFPVLQKGVYEDDPEERRQSVSLAYATVLRERVRESAVNADSAFEAFVESHHDIDKGLGNREIQEVTTDGPEGHGVESLFQVEEKDPQLVGRIFPMGEMGICHVRLQGGNELVRAFPWPTAGLGIREEVVRFDKRREARCQNGGEQLVQSREQSYWPVVCWVVGRATLE